MLRGIHPLLGPDLLHALQSMGHGDEIVLADANFPASTMGPKVIRADGLEGVPLLRAILTHFPLDTFVPAAAWRMEVVDEPARMPEICTEFQSVIRELAGSFEVEPLKRFAFYERSKSAAYIVATGEQRLYANLILKKGVVRLEETVSG
ncbi:MAG: RbsD/FucU family protein [Phyllobacterium sp.]